MPMYFIQHGKAVPKEIDPDRPLSDEGREEVERLAAYLRRTGVAVKQIYHSGKTRARQTAELFEKQIGFGRMVERPGMNPLDSVAEFAQDLEEDAMYVGHLPFMEKLVSYLTAGDEDAGVVAFSCGGVVCIAHEEGKHHIEWCIPPSVCTV